MCTEDNTSMDVTYVTMRLLGLTTAHGIISRWHFFDHSCRSLKPIDGIDLDYRSPCSRSSYHSRTLSEVQRPSTVSIAPMSRAALASCPTIKPTGRSLVAAQTVRAVTTVSGSHADCVPGMMRADLRTRCEA